MKREVGYYWVRRKPYGKVLKPKLEVGKWDGKAWKIFSSFAKIVHESQRLDYISDQPINEPRL